MNHLGEIAPLTRLVRPHVAVVTTVEPVHIEYFRSIWGIADAKGEIFAGPRARRRRRSSIATIPITSASAPTPPPRRAGASSPSASIPQADVRAERIILKADLSVVEARVLGTPVIYRLGTPGRHMALNSLEHPGRREGARRRPCPDDARARRPEAAGRARRAHRARRRAANSSSSTRATTPIPPRCAPRWRPWGRRSRASADAASPCSATCWSSARRARACIAGWPSRSPSDRVDLVFAAGPLMENLFEALPRDRRGAYAATAADLKDAVLDVGAARRRRHDQGIEQHPHGSDRGSSERAICRRRQSRGVEKVMI